MRVRRGVLLTVWFAACAWLLPAGSASAVGAACSAVPHAADVRAPTRTAAWRADVLARTPVYDRLPRKRPHGSRRLTVRQAPSLLVIGRARGARGRCWLRVRLPWRPNRAAGWIAARRVELVRTPWRIVVSTRSRSLEVFRAGKLVRRMRVVVGKPSTPTPVGLFAVVWAIRWHPNDFLGSWVLELSAHSNVLQEFDGGDGTVGIHGRGGASLLDPLGSARSHGCIRLANKSITWLVHTIGEARISGTPVRVR